VRTIAGTYRVRISKAWLATQAAMAMDNPVDEARVSGRPSLVDFGSVGCRACEMMAPILDKLKEKYEGRANVLFVQVGESQVLAARFGIRSIPVQIFFDAKGNEVFRHTGFFAQEKIETKLAELGVE
jgi:thioredoxin 1